MGTPEFITQLRTHVGTAELPLIGVSGIIRRDDGAVLLARRADTGEWSTVSGIVEPGEEPAFSLVREAQEEVGVVIEVLDLVGVHQLPVVTYPNGDRARFLDLVFTGRVVAGEPHVADEESSEVGWFDPDRLPAPTRGSLAAKLALATGFTGRTSFARPGDK